jgi:hypothetical protein
MGTRQERGQERAQALGHTQQGSSSPQLLASSGPKENTRGSLHPSEGRVVVVVSKELEDILTPPWPLPYLALHNTELENWHLQSLKHIQEAHPVSHPLLLVCRGLIMLSAGWALAPTSFSIIG